MFLKRMLSTILSAVLLLSLLAGCTPPVSPTDPSAPTTLPTDPTGSIEQNPPAQTVTVYCLQEAVVWLKEGRKVVRSQFVYDEYGNLLNRSSDAYGYDKTEEIYRYDDTGKLIYHPDRVGGASNPVSLTYDENGRLHTKTCAQDKWVYSYDEAGNLITEEHWNKGELINRNTLTYNAAGQLLSQRDDAIKAEQRDDYSIDWVYDDRGNLLSVTYRQGDHLLGVEIYAYDANDRLTVEKRVWDGITQIYKTHSYDERGMLIRTESYLNHHDSVSTGGPFYLVYLYEYDERGNKIRQTVVNETGGETVTDWTYDSQGNLLAEDDGSTRFEWTYDQWGNVLTHRGFQSEELQWEITYTYTAFQVLPALVGQICQVQEQYFGGPELFE